MFLKVLCHFNSYTHKHFLHILFMMIIKCILFLAGVASVYYCLYCHAVVQGSSRNLKVWVQMIKLLDLWMNALEISNFHEIQIQFLKKCGCSYTHCIQTSATPVVCRVLVQRLLPVSRVSSNFLPLLSTFHNLTTACTFSPT